MLRTHSIRVEFFRVCFVKVLCSIGYECLRLFFSNCLSEFEQWPYVSGEFRVRDFLSDPETCLILH